METEKQGGFSFSIKKKTPTQKLKESSFAENVDKDKKKTDFIVAFSENKVESLEPEEEEKELVIPLIQKNRWHGHDTLSEGTSHNHHEEKKPSLFTKKKLLDGQSLSGLDKEAANEIMKETQDYNETWNERDKEGQTLTIPLLMVNKPPEGFETDDKLDVSIRPDEAEEADYNSVPITSFGMAMLRGMGWKETEGIGNKMKKVVQPIEAFSRPKGQGLGADRGPSKKKTTKGKEGELEEDVEGFVKGAGILVKSGPHRNLYGLIEGIDEDNARLMIKLAISGQVTTISQFNAQAVSRSEYKKYAKDLGKFSEGHDVLKKQKEKEKEREIRSERRKKEDDKNRKEKSDVDRHRTGERDRRKHRDKGDDDRGENRGDRLDYRIDRRDDRSDRRDDKIEGGDDRIDRQEDRIDRRDDRIDRRDDRIDRQEDRIDRRDDRIDRRDDRIDRRDDRIDRQDDRIDRRGDKKEYREKDRRRHDEEENVRDSETSHERKRRRDDKKEEDSDGSKKSKSQEKKQDKSNAHSSNHWLRPDLRVRFIDRKYKNGRYYNTKVHVVDVITRDVCSCKTDEGKLLEDINESMLETLIPRTEPGYIMVVQGKFTGQVGTVLNKDKRKCEADVQMLRDHDQIVKLKYDSICEYVGDIQMAEDL